MYGMYLWSMSVFGVGKEADPIAPTPAASGLLVTGRYRR